MSEAKHTGGDWVVERGGEMMRENERLIISTLKAGTATSCREIRSIGRVFDYAGPEESIGNAHLFAASKDLLAQLKIATAHIEHMAAFIATQRAGYSFESLGGDMHGIRAAITKATGTP